MILYNTSIITLRSKLKCIVYGTAAQCNKTLTGNCSLYLSICCSKEAKQQENLVPRSEFHAVEVIE